MFSYYDNNGDQRLKQIWNQQPNMATLSKFGYQYDAGGRITQWTQQAGAGTTQVMTLEYDFEDQLLNAVITPQAGSATKVFTYGYDAAQNRTSEEVDTMTPSQVSTVTSSAYNSVNQLTGRTGPGPVRFRGKVNEPATVTVAGQPARMANDPAATPYIAAALGVSAAAAAVAGTALGGEVAASRGCFTLSRNVQGHIASDAERAFSQLGERYCRSRQSVMRSDLGQGSATTRAIIRC